MKTLFFTFILIVLNQSAQAALTCKFECVQKTSGTLTSFLGATAANAVHFGARDYGSWSRTCQIINQEGAIYMKDKTSGALLIGMSFQIQGSNPGHVLKSKMDRKIEAQNVRVATLVQECGIQN